MGHDGGKKRQQAGGVDGTPAAEVKKERTDWAVNPLSMEGNTSRRTQ